MKFVTIAFIAAIALSVAAPAFAYENDLENGAPAPSMQPKNHQRAAMHGNPHRGFDARAHAPVAAPLVGPYDFGIGNQGT